MNPPMDNNDHEIAASSLRPIHTNTFALPNDRATKIAHRVYDPAFESLVLESEKGRTIFAEAFITNPRLGTLADLCVRVLVQETGVRGFRATENDPLKQRLQLDTINVDEPLENIYEIEDIKFWRRIALSKTKNFALKLYDETFDWKTEGITLKFVEIVEECPAEYWPEKRMRELADKIKDYVFHMHIKKLQPLKDTAFLRYAGRDSDTDKSTSTDVSHSTSDSEFVGMSEEVEGEEEFEESGAPGEYLNAVEDQETDFDRKTKFSEPTHLKSRWSFFNRTTTEMDEESEIDESRLIAKVEEQIKLRREDRRKRREAQKLRRYLREEKRLKREEENERKRNRKNQKKIRIKNVFDLPIDEPEDEEYKLKDFRNLESYLKIKQKTIYKTKHCHHIDLSFLRHFDNLVSFCIEFQPPELKTNYHPRYFEFSYEDVKNLGRGISDLKNLRIFRLRHSRMDSEKLATIVFALQPLEIEVIDFGYDNLLDDNELVIHELFQNKSSIKSLELEGNQLGFNTLAALGRVLQYYGGKLEYLGLARNTIDSDTLHALTNKIMNTSQIESLCLAGNRITDVAMICCIGGELLTKHTVLRCLNIMGAPLSSKSADHLIKCMRLNQNLLELDCRGCNLSESIEMDIQICLLRNRFQKENNYIGNKEKTGAEILEFVKRIKNPLLLSVNEKLEKRKACLNARPNIFEAHSTESYSTFKTPFSVDVNSNYFFTTRPSIFPNADDTFDHSYGEESSVNSQPSFKYNVMNFDEKQLLEHVEKIGPANRFYYIKSKLANSCTPLN